MYLLSKFGDYSPSRSEQCNDGSLHVENLFCGQCFLRNDGTLTRRWKMGCSKNLTTIFVLRFYAFFTMLLNLNQSEFVQFVQRFLLNNFDKAVFWITIMDTPIGYPICVPSVFNLPFCGSLFKKDFAHCFHRKQWFS